MIELASRLLGHHDPQVTAMDQSFDLADLNVEQFGHVFPGDRPVSAFEAAKFNLHEPPFGPGADFWNIFRMVLETSHGRSIIPR